jgi:hypothetical protein
MQRSINSIEFPKGGGPARFIMWPSPRMWTRRPSTSSMVEIPLQKACAPPRKVRGERLHPDLVGEVTGVRQDHVIAQDGRRGSVYLGQVQPR